MPLLTDELRSRLPSLHAQEADDNPIVYAKFVLPGTAMAWYVTEGQPAGDEFAFYGFITEPVNDFGNFYLSQLEGIRGPHGACVIDRDPDFTPGRFTDVVPMPHL